jgi:hypothetical protein
MDGDSNIILIVGLSIAMVLMFIGTVIKNKPIKTINTTKKNPIMPITRKAEVGENVVCIKVNARSYVRAKYEIGDIGVVQQSEENFIFVLGWQDTLTHDSYVIINKDWTKKED